MGGVGNYHHGHTGKSGAYMSPTYITWNSMKQRCYNKKHEAHKRYSSITVCDEWKNSFENFLKDMGERPASRTLDRIDNTKGYSKENCRWATLTEQANNTKRNVHLIIDGKRKNLKQLSETYNLPKTTLYCRMHSNWSINQIIGLEPRRKKEVDMEVPDGLTDIEIIKFLRKNNFTYSAIGKYFGLTRQRIQQLDK